MCPDSLWSSRSALIPCSLLTWSFVLPLIPSACGTPIQEMEEENPWSFKVTLYAHSAEECPGVHWVWDTISLEELVDAGCLSLDGVIVVEQDDNFFEYAVDVKKLKGGLVRQSPSCLSMATGGA